MSIPIPDNLSQPVRSAKYMISAKDTVRELLARLPLGYEGCQTEKTRHIHEVM